MTTESATFEKASSSELDYKFDWKARTNGSDDPEMTDWLESGETIDDFEISVEAVTTGCLINIVDSYLADSDTSVVAWISGGDHYKEYFVICEIWTSSSPVPRRDQRAVKIKILK